MKLKILNISKFRGVPNSLTLDFTDNFNNPISSIIFGDNGSGKSSIIDALEFTLQAQIEHSTSVRNPTRPSVLSFKYSDRELSLPSCAITFEDDTSFERSIHCEIKEKGDEKVLIYSIFPTHHLPFFNFSSIVLRRNDLYRFSTIPDEQKQVMLWKFFFLREKKTIILKSDPEAILLEQRRIEVKSRRKQLGEELAALLKVKPEEIPLNTNDFNLYVANSDRIVKLRKFYPKNSIGYQMQVHLSKEQAEIQSLVKKIRQTNEELSSIKKEQTAIKKPSEGSLVANIKPYLDKASNYLYDGFMRISNAPFVKNIYLELGRLSATSINVIIELENGIKTSPQKIFSEANQDLIILLLYVSLIKVAQDLGQSKVIVLDDVLQSVDSTIRTKFVEYILEAFSDNQIFVTAHDRLWLNQLRVMFQQHNHKFKEFQILNWDFYTGPNIIENKYPKADNSLKQALETNNALVIASISGVFLERICQKLSTSLSISLHRKAEDKYTLGELWPGIFKILKKSSLNQMASKINHFLFIRNFIGCHYNEWAESLSNQEIIEFANSVQSLYESVFCCDCACWITKLDNEFKCKCGALKL